MARAIESIIGANAEANRVAGEAEILLAKAE